MLTIAAVGVPLCLIAWARLMRAFDPTNKYPITRGRPEVLAQQTRRAHHG